MLWDKQSVFQVEGSTQAKCKRQVRLRRVLRLKTKIEYKSLNIKIKAKQSTETKEIRVLFQVFASLLKDSP